MSDYVIDPGEMKWPIVIEKATTTTNPNTGEEQEVWDSWRAVWARWRPRHGGERYEGDQLVAQRLDHFDIYYIAELNEKDFRIIHNDRVFEIESIIPLGMNNYQDIKCEVKDNETPS